jgi:hypothetical protein
VMSMLHVLFYVLVLHVLFYVLVFSFFFAHHSLLRANMKH